ncbi:hypothetical protein AURDEDRAFT_151339 [Auricularia subglabra TFB-10046 SS5]|nr:hypothetical protein AURDEDRAFT_151339 [Auricularia subglabra TFB-10046 SS5]
MISEDTYLPDDLLAHSAPRLHSLSFSGLALRDRPYAALAGLRRLCISQHEVNLAQILTFYPRLEQLYISATSIGSCDQRTGSHNLAVLHVPGIRESAEIVCTKPVLAQPVTVWADVREEHLFAYILETVPPADARHIKLLFDANSRQSACVVAYSSGLTWVVELWPRDSPLAICNAEIMASITELTIHELEWPRGPLEFPSALNLTRLEIILHFFSVPSSSAEPLPTLVGMFSDHDDSLCILRCPALKELAVLSPTQPALTVDVFDVLDFVSRHLRFAAEPLPRLTLRNVYLHDPTWGRGMELLSARVQRIEYSDFRELGVPYIHQNHGSMSWVYSMLG